MWDVTSSTLTGRVFYIDRMQNMFNFVLRVMADVFVPVDNTFVLRN